MPGDLLSDLLQVLRKHNLIKETKLIHHQIRVEYDELTAKIDKGEVKMEKKEVREFLSDKYCTSTKNIEAIIYPKGKSED